MTSKFYKLKIGDLWLTENGLENGSKICRSEVVGANLFQTQVAGSVIDTVGGRVVQYVPFTRDKDFEIKVLKMPSDVWTDLIALRESLLIADDDVNITGTTLSGNPGNFEVQAKPRPDEMFTYERFNSGYVFGVSMKFYKV